MPSAKHQLHLMPLALVSLLCLLLIGVVGVSAQAVPVSLPLGQPLPGSITPPETQVIYQFEVEGPMNVDLQVLSLTPGFFPSFLVIDPSGVTLVSINNNGAQTTLNGTVSMVAGAPYRIIVQSFGSVAGQFVVSAQASTTPVTPAQPSRGQIVNGLVSAQPTSLSYSLSRSELRHSTADRQQHRHDGRGKCAEHYSARCSHRRDPRRDQRQADGQPLPPPYSRQLHRRGQQRWQRSAAAFHALSGIGTQRDQLRNKRRRRAAEPLRADAGCPPRHRPQPPTPSGALSTPLEPVR